MSLYDQLDFTDPLLVLSQMIDWNFICILLSPFYSELGRKSTDLRTYAGLIMLKYLENHSDESLIQEYIRNPYYQAFCGATGYNTVPPCHPSKLSIFREKIGQRGAEIILAASACAYGLEAFDDIVIIDSTAQPKYIGYPTDKKLARDILHACRAIAIAENIKLERTFEQIEAKLIKIINFSKNRKNNGSDDALVELKKIATALVTHLENKLHEKAIFTYDQKIELFRRILKQTKNSKNKIYSIIEPQVQCLIKGKPNHKCEYGSKVGIIISKKSGIILGAISYDGNPHDSKTMEVSIEQLQRMYSPIYMPSTMIGDLGYRILKTKNQDPFDVQVCNVKIITPDLLKKLTSDEGRKHLIKQLKSRSKIEPIIGHLKSDYRLSRNFLHHEIGDKVNCIYSAVAFNLKKVMNAVKAKNDISSLIANYALITALKSKIIDDIISKKNAKSVVEQNKKSDNLDNKLF
jgi:IS5 family transposase